MKESLVEKKSIIERERKRLEQERLELKELEKSYQRNIEYYYLKEFIENTPSSKIDNQISLLREKECLLPYSRLNIKDLSLAISTLDRIKGNNTEVVDYIYKMISPINNEERKFLTGSARLIGTHKLLEEFFILASGFNRGEELYQSNSNIVVLKYDPLDSSPIQSAFNGYTNIVESYNDKYPCYYATDYFYFLNKKNNFTINFKDRSDIETFILRVILYQYQTNKKTIDQDTFNTIFKHTYKTEIVQKSKIKTKTYEEGEIL